MSQSGGVGALVGAVAGRVVKLTGRGDARPQTVTVSRPVQDVLAAWRDPAILARLLGDVADVERDEDGRYRWTLTLDQSPIAPSDRAARGWVTELVGRADGLRFAAPGAEGGAAPGAEGGAAPGAEGGSAGDGMQVDVAVREAPRDLGTEVRLLLDLPVPGRATGAAAFTVLYRLRALLQTGEIPTLGPQPSARPGPR